LVSVYKGPMELLTIAFAHWVLPVILARSGSPGIREMPLFLYPISYHPKGSFRCTWF
jgi:hypothetical protein